MPLHFLKKNSLLTKFKKIFFSIFSKSNLYNYLIQLGTILINLLLLPMLLTILNKERFGVWQTMLSIISYVSLLNFGLGNGLRNSITKYSIHNDFNSINKAIGQTIIKMTKIILLASLIIFPLYFLFFNPTVFFRNLSNINVEVKISIAIYLLFFMTNIILSLSTSISFGLRKSYQPGFVNLIYLLLVYFTIFFLNKCYLLNLITISIIFGFYQSLSFLFLFLYQKYFQKIKINFIEKINLNEMNKLSTQFFFVQIISLIFFTSDNIVVANKLGAEQTAEFSIVSKIYMTLITVFSILLIQFWNNVTAFYEKKNYLWIKKTITNLSILSSLVLIVGFIIAYFHQTIINFWFGQQNNLNLYFLTFLLFTIYAFLHCLNAILVNFQNGIGDMKIQIFSTIIVMIVYFGLIFIYDINIYGYNYLIIIKIFSILIGLIINCFSLTKLKS